MDTFWIMAAALILVLLGLSVRIMITRRNYQRSGMEFRRNTVGKSYFDRNKSCHAYTRQLLEKLAPGRVLAGLRIPCEGGEASVALVLVHATGVYVFEIKDYGGLLSGDADSEFWSLALPGGRTEKLYNPFWQGTAQTKALEELLRETGASPFYLYVVFGQRCKLQAVPEPGENMALVKREDVRALLEKDLAQRPDVLLQEQMDAVLKKLKPYVMGK